MHSGGRPSMADMTENPSQQAALARLITSSPTTAGARASQAPLRANYVVPFSGGARHFGHASRQPVAPATNTSPATHDFQPNNHPFGWTAPRPLLLPASHLAPRPVQPSDRVVRIGALPLPPRGARFVPQPWTAAPNGSGGAEAPPVGPNRCYAASWAPPPAVRLPPRVGAGGPPFSAGGTARVRFSQFLPVPDKSFEEFLVERGVLDGPIHVSPPRRNASPGPAARLGVVGSGRVEPAGLVSGAGASVVYQGGLATVAGLGTGPSGGQMGLSTVRGSEASGAGAVPPIRGRGRAAAHEAKERRRKRMEKNREAAARARERKLAAARGSPDDNQEQAESWRS